MVRTSLFCIIVIGKKALVKDTSVKRKNYFLQDLLRVVRVRPGVLRPAGRADPPHPPERGALRVRGARALQGLLPRLRLRLPPGDAQVLPGAGGGGGAAGGVPPAGGDAGGGGARRVHGAAGDKG